MELQGTWTKDPEGYMEFDNYQLQRLYEVVIEQYYQVYNRYLDALDDEEAAADQARQEGYEMLTDYKEINGVEEFATIYKTPAYLMDVWYEFDDLKNKRIYERGFLRIIKR